MNLDNMVLTSDTARMEAGGQSVFEKVANAIQYGPAAATVSGLAGIANTAIWARNKIFDQEIEEINVGDTLDKLSANVGQYYRDNKDPLDTVGFLGASFIPGMAALKGLQLARTGKASGTFANVMGFTLRGQQNALKAGLEELATEGPSVFASINANKMKAIGFGFADNALQAAVFETAAALSMHQAPMLKDESWSDIAYDIVKTSLVGGAIGGGIEALFVNKIFKDAGKAVDAQLRKVDSIAALDDMGLLYGDKTFSLANSILSLPKELAGKDRIVDFTYSLNGQTFPETLNIGKLADRKVRDTVQAGTIEFHKRLTEVVGNDASVGTPLARALVKVLHQGREGNKSVDAVTDEIGKLLFNLKKVEGISSDSEDLTREVFYFIRGAKITDKESTAQAITTTKPGGAATAYALHGNFADIKGGVLGIADAPATFKEAWKAGFDVVIDPHKQEFVVNPASERLRAINPKSEDPYARMIFNPRTHTTSTNGIANIADVATPTNPLRPPSITGVVSGKHTFEFRAGNFDPQADSIKTTARTLWASKITNLHDTVIDARDFALLDRLHHAPQIANEGTKIRMADGTIKEFNWIADYGNWLHDQKVIAAGELFTAGAKEVDPRLIAYKVGSEQIWVEEAIAKDFDPLRMTRTNSAFRPQESLGERDNLVMVYDKASQELAEKFPTGMLAYHQRVQDAIRKSDELSGAVLGSDAALLPDMYSAGRNASTAGAGPGFLGASNANYDDPLGRVVQAIGQQVGLIQQKFRNAALEVIQGPAAKLLNQPTAELGAILTKARLTPDLLTVHQGHLVDLASLQKHPGALAGKDFDEFKIAIPVSEQVEDFLLAYKTGHDKWIDNKTLLASAKGTTIPWEREALYLPPVDTRKVPYFAFIRKQEGSVFSTSEVAMVTARSQDELTRLTGQIQKDNPTLQVLFKDDTAQWHKAMGDYEYQAGMNAPNLDPYLRKKGLLGDYAPTMDPQAVIEEFVNFIGRREDSIVRAAVSTKYAQPFAELKWLSSQNTKPSKSMFAFIGKKGTKKLDDPFGDYMRQALNVSKQAEYTLWHDANEFVDALGTRAYQAVEGSYNQARQGKISWEDANAELERMGLPKPFTSQESYLTAQAGGDGNLIKSAVHKGNMLLATIGLRLDMANSIVNVIASPLMLSAEVSSIKNSLKKDPELFGKIDEMLSVAVPGAGLRVPTAGKLMANAIGTYFSAEKDKLFARYASIGAIKDINSQYHEMLKDLQLTPNLVPGKWAKLADKWTEKGATLTGSNFAEDFTRFMSADVMRQITQPVVDAGKMSIKEQDSYIRIFVNRAQGNYTASQRPIAFQGTIGAAISLFQTYQFNLYQQMFRHIENRDAKTLAVMGALQTSLFGLNGLPLFDAINTHLIGTASINEGHHDIYSKTVQLTGKEMGDWALYGTASAMPIFSDKMPALYTRGDLNPRSMTLLPTSFADIPIVSVATRAVGAVVGMAQQIGGGVDLHQAFLHGMEHNGVSRPLAGIAQALQGASTTSKAGLIAAHSDFLSIATATRALGAKPMDESIALNHLFRLNAYKAYDTDRIEKLGTVVKQKIRQGELTSEDTLDFATEYAARGGRAEGYSAAMQRWTRQATQSDVNRIMEAHSSARGQRLMEVMGADPLPDYERPDE